jgi:integrase-like protein
MPEGARGGAPFCITTRRTLPPWTCSLSRPSASICSMPSSLFAWTAEILVWINVTTNPTAEWIARQVTEAFPWDDAPQYLIRDRDRVYGAIFKDRVCARGIRDKPIAPASPWQNCFVERLIGSIRRGCVDHLVVLSEAHLRRSLRAYARYYNYIRTHRSLDKDAPVFRPVQRTGSISSNAILGGLHHHYVRV